MKIHSWWVIDECQDELDAQKIADLPGREFQWRSGAHCRTEVYPALRVLHLCSKVQGQNFDPRKPQTSSRQRHFCSFHNFLSTTDAIMAEGAGGIDRKADERMEFSTSKEVTVHPTFESMSLKGMSQACVS